MSGKVATATWLAVSQLLAISIAVLVVGGMFIFLILGGANCPGCVRGRDGAAVPFVLVLLVTVP